MRYQFTPRDADRFWSKVDKYGPIPAHRPELGHCWPWTASSNGKGYGTFSVRKAATGQWGSEYAHRVAFEATYGPLSAGECALHRCDNRRCSRPDHLFKGSKGDNNRDMTEKGRNVLQTRPELVLTGTRRFHAAHPEARDGTRNGRARLTETNVPIIRARYGDGMNGVRLVDLANEYGVTIQSIWAAIKRKTWPHVP
jgi:hypothetical protein